MLDTESSNAGCGGGGGDGAKKDVQQTAVQMLDVHGWLIAWSSKGVQATILNLLAQILVQTDPSI